MESTIIHCDCLTIQLFLFVKLVGSSYAQNSMLSAAETGSLGWQVNLFTANMQCSLLEQMQLRSSWKKATIYVKVFVLSQLRYPKNNEKQALMVVAFTIRSVIDFVSANSQNEQNINFSIDIIRFNLYA